MRYRLFQYKHWFLPNFELKHFPDSPFTPCTYHLDICKLEWAKRSQLTLYQGCMIVSNEGNSLYCDGPSLARITQPSNNVNWLLINHSTANVDILFWLYITQSFTNSDLFKLLGLKQRTKCGDPSRMFLKRSTREYLKKVEIVCWDRLWEYCWIGLPWDWLTSEDVVFVLKL